MGRGTREKRSGNGSYWLSLPLVSSVAPSSRRPCWFGPTFANTPENYWKSRPNERRNCGSSREGKLGLRELGKLVSMTNKHFGPLTVSTRLTHPLLPPLADRGQ